MKIGILTLHSNTNFGGGLQQIALFETLRGMGHEPGFLCVRDTSRLPGWKRLAGILTSYSARQLAGAVSEGLKRLLPGEKKAAKTPNWKLYEKTDDFNYSRLNYTPKFGLDELPGYVAGCDALVCGSDQVWTDVYSEVLPYFCGGMPDYRGRKIAYAACSVHGRAPIYNRRRIRQLLSDFDAISVRDATTARLVERYLPGARPRMVCDPTLIYDFGKYLAPSPVEGEYIFAYVLGDKDADWHRRNIERIKAQTGVGKVVALTVELDDRFPWADEVITDALAVDWMNLLRGAAFVYTNSFHAVLFSLKFHREFAAYYGDLVRSSRMVGLSEQFGLESRIVREPGQWRLDEPIDFGRTDAQIAALARESMGFLRKSLE